MYNSHRNFAPDKSCKEKPLPEKVFFISLLNKVSEIHCQFKVMGLLKVHKVAKVTE